MKKPKVYIAGPYTGENIRNIAEALKWANILYNQGFIPFVPHISGFWDLIHPMHYDNWMEYDKEWLLVCDCLFKFGGFSSGAQEEMIIANKNNIPVFHMLHQIEEWKLDTWKESQA